MPIERFKENILDESKIISCFPSPRVSGSGAATGSLPLVAPGGAAPRTPSIRPDTSSGSSSALSHVASRRSIILSTPADSRHPRRDTSGAQGKQEQILFSSDPLVCPVSQFEH